MTRSEWLTLVMREANRFVEKHRDEAAQTLARDGGLLEMAEKIEESIKRALVEAESLEDLIRFSPSPKDPSWWREEEIWSAVVYQVAYRSFLADVEEAAVRILRGEIPRIDSASIKPPEPIPPAAERN